MEKGKTIDYKSFFFFFFLHGKELGSGKKTITNIDHVSGFKYTGFMSDLAG
jgi:hypothetical protein